MKESIIEVAKKMMNTNKKVFQGLHETFGLDFENENNSVEIHEIKLPVTLNKIIKDFQISKDQVNILLIQRYNKKEFRVIMFNNYGDFKIDGFYTGWNKGIDDYCRKSDFNDDRKVEDFECYLITANKEDVAFTMADLKEYNKKSYIEDKQKAIMNNYKENEKCLNRIRYDKKDIRTVWNNGEHYAYGLFNGKIDNYNFNANIEYGYYQRKETHENDLFDKSGYNVKIKREKLQNKATELRAERKLKQLQKMDFSEENRQIENKINNAKNILIDRLKNVDFENEKYIQILRNLDRLRDIYRDFKHHEEKINNAMNGNSEYHYYNYTKTEQVEESIKKYNDRLQQILL